MRSTQNAAQDRGRECLQDHKPVTIPILEMDPQATSARCAALEASAPQRDPGRVGQALDRLRLACQGTENTMPYILEAVRAYATLGEIIDVMKEVFGVYEEPNGFRTR